jgi:hypothetical protein
MIKKMKSKKRVIMTARMVRKKNKRSYTRKGSYGRSKINSLYQHGIVDT